jgi:hypothetical protein
MEKGGAPKVTLNQTNWMQYNIPGAVKTNGSQKVYKFCDENWEIVSKQLYTLYMNLRK